VGAAVRAREGPFSDFTVRTEGTLVLFTPTTEAARDWWTENVAEGVTIGVETHVVEHRFARDIIVGARADGFTVGRG
jgi:phage gp46-like protein